MAPIPQAGTTTQAAAGSPAKAAEVPPAPAPTAASTETVPADPFDGSVFAPILPTLPAPPAVTASATLPTFRLPAGAVPRLEPPRVGEVVDCQGAKGKGHVLQVTPYDAQSLDWAGRIQPTFQDSPSGESFLPDHELQVSCENTRVVGSPHGYLEKHTWQETQRVGVDAEHAFGGPTDPEDGTSPAHPVSAWTTMRDDRTEVTGVRRASIANHATTTLRYGMAAGLEFAVPLTRFATPLVDAAAEKAASVVVDHLGGGASRTDRLQKRIGQTATTPKKTSKP